jgi:hypothetical protein
MRAKKRTVAIMTLTDSEESDNKDKKNQHPPTIPRLNKFLISPEKRDKKSYSGE